MTLFAASGRHAVPIDGTEVAYPAGRPPARSVRVPDPRGPVPSSAIRERV